MVSCRGFDVGFNVMACTLVACLVVGSRWCFDVGLAFLRVTTLAILVVSFGWRIGVGSTLVF